MFITLINFSGVQYTHYFWKVVSVCPLYNHLITPVNTQKRASRGKLCTNEKFVSVKGI